jgi:hypothetical protein
MRDVRRPFDVAVITIDTTRFSAVVSEFLRRYPNAVAKLDKVPQTAALGEWCTNARLAAAIDFSLVEGSEEILGFHDGPRNMWATDSTLPLVESLAERKLLRFRVARPRVRGFFSWVLGGRV